MPPPAVVVPLTPTALYALLTVPYLDRDPILPGYEVVDGVARLQFLDNDHSITKDEREHAAGCGPELGASHASGGSGNAAVLWPSPSQVDNSDDVMELLSKHISRLRRRQAPRERDSNLVSTGMELTGEQAEGSRLHRALVLLVDTLRGGFEVSSSTSGEGRLVELGARVEALLARGDITAELLRLEPQPVVTDTALALAPPCVLVVDTSGGELSGSLCGFGEGSFYRAALRSDLKAVCGLSLSSLPAEVLPGRVYLGDGLLGRNAEALSLLFGGDGGVRVLNATTSRHADVEERFPTLFLDIEDRPSTDFRILLPQALEFVRRGGDVPVFIHCEQGVSRSGALAIATVASLCSPALSLSFALLRVSAARGVTEPLDPFILQLIEFFGGEDTEPGFGGIPGNPFGCAFRDFLFETVRRGHVGARAATDILNHQV